MPSDRRSSGAVSRSDDLAQDPRYGQNLPFKQMPPGSLPARSYLAAPVRSRRRRAARRSLLRTSRSRVLPRARRAPDRRPRGPRGHRRGQRAPLPRGAGGARGGRGGERPEGRVPGHPVPRAADAADRHRRLGPPAPARPALARRDDPGRGHHHPERHRAEPDHRRAARRVADHHRQAPARSAARRHRDRREGGDRDGDPGGQRQGHTAPAHPGPGGELRHGRSRAPPAGVLEPVLERHQVHVEERPGPGERRVASARTSRSSSPTPAWASTPSSFPTSSTGSRRRTRRARGTPAASAWAFPSRASWSSCTAAASRRRVPGSARAPRSRRGSPVPRSRRRPLDPRVYSQADRIVGLEEGARPHGDTGAGRGGRRRRPGAGGEGARDPGRHREDGRLRPARPWTSWEGNGSTCS